MKFEDYGISLAESWSPIGSFEVGTLQERRAGQYERRVGRG